MAMQKQLKVKTIDYEFDWSDCSIKTIEEDIKNLKELGATDILLEIDNYYNDSIDFQALKIRPETDEEYKKRLEISKETEDINRKKELQQLRELLTKYPLEASKLINS